MNNLLKRICKDYNLNDNKKRLTTRGLHLLKNNRRKQNMAKAIDIAYNTREHK